MSDRAPRGGTLWLISICQLGVTIRLGLCVVLVGLCAGLGAMGLALLLHAVQHFTYNYDTGQWLGRDSFLQGVGLASPWRRLAALSGAGLMAGTGWFALYRRGRPLVSVGGAIAGQPMPPMSAENQKLSGQAFPVSCVAQCADHDCGMWIGVKADCHLLVA